VNWDEWVGQTAKMVDTWRGGQLLAGGGTSQLRWVSGMDPGKATGLAHVVYLVPPTPERVEGLSNGQNGRRGAGDRVGLVGYAVDQWAKILAGLRVQNVPGGLLQTYDATGVIVLSFYSEFFTGDENSIVRRAVSRVRDMGSCWAGTPSWGVGEESGLGAVTCERFKVLRQDPSEDYVSPLRVRSAFSYGLEDEFGVRITGHQPADAKNAFGAVQFKQLGMWLSGPDHVRDALSHALFEIRKANS